MGTQSFPAGDAPRITLNHCDGDLVVERWDERQIEVTTDERPGRIEPQDGGLVIERVDDDLRLRVPADARIEGTRLRGGLRVSGVATVQLCGVAGDVNVSDVEQLVLQDGDEHGTCDVNIERVGTVEIETVGGDLTLREVQSAVLGDIGGDGTAEVRESLRFGSIGGDLHVRGNGQLEARGGSIGGDCSAHDLRDLMIGSVGGDATIVDVQGDVHLGPVGGDADVRSEHGIVRAGIVGGDLRLRSAFPADGSAGLQVGGDARIELPEQPNLTIQAMVGGDTRGPGVRAGSGMIELVYGEGPARLTLTVGGDLELRGGGEPRSSAGMGDANEWERSWEQFGDEMGRAGEEFGRGMEQWGEEFGRKMEQWGEEFGRNMEANVGGWGREQGDKWRRKAEQQAERASDKVRRAQQRAAERGARGEVYGDSNAGKARIRVNDRERTMDREQLERLKEQAQQAAREGIGGALEAVERALSSLGMPQPPQPPRPTVVPNAPQPPAPVTGPTMRLDSEDAGTEDAGSTAPLERLSAPTVEEERAAILRMVAEGRISSEEGDMLLEALGS